MKKALPLPLPRRFSGDMRPQVGIPRLDPYLRHGRWSAATVRRSGNKKEE